MKFKLPIFVILVFSLFSMVQVRGQKVFKQLSIKDIYRDYLFYPRLAGPFKSMKDSRYYTILRNSVEIISCDYETGNMESILFTARESGLSSIYDYELSDDEKYILLTTSRVQIYRHSYHADYYIYDRDNKVLSALSKNGKQQLAEFSPDGKHVAFVRNNDLFLTELPLMKETRITFDGKKNAVINGAPDWVYEEEFALTKAFSWSPDSKRIAFYRFDEAEVREYPLIRYSDVYPELVTFKYPKAGEKNSVVSIHVFDLSNGETKKIDTGAETDQYIGRIFWTRNPEVLSVVRINRQQNRMDILHASVSTGITETVYTEINKRYIREPEDDMIYYLDDDKNFIIKSEKNGFLHLYLYDFVKKSAKPVTQGEFDISEFLGYDEKTKKVFYLSHERSPLNQDIYSIGLNGKGKIRLSEGKGWHEAEFNNSYKYFVRYYSTADQPDLVSIHSASGSLVRIVDDNRVIAERMKEFGFGRTEFMKVPVSAEMELNAYMIKPPDYDPGKKYPLLMFVYGGPESQKVIDAYSSSTVWLQIFVQKGYIVACVDGRGTGSRGEEFRKSTWLPMAEWFSPWH